MLRLLPLLLLLGCDATTDATDIIDGPAVGCIPGERRTYDAAEDPSLMDFKDPAVTFTANEVTSTLLGDFSGTYTPATGAPFSVELSMSVDGLITVQDFEGPGCSSVWSTTLVLAMSSERINDGYAIDDLWSPTLLARTLDGGRLSGSKPASDFDGTLPMTGDVGIQALFSDAKWNGSLSDGGDEHGTFVLSR